MSVGEKLCAQLDELDRCGIPARVVLLEGASGDWLSAQVAQRIDVCETEEKLERVIADFQPTIISTTGAPDLLNALRRLAPEAHLILEGEGLLDPAALAAERAKVDELKREIAEEKRLVRSLEQRLEWQRERIATLERQLDDVERLERQIAAFERRFEQQAAEIANRDLQNRALEALLNEKNTELAKISASRYWRLLTFYWRARSLLRGRMRRLGAPAESDSLKHPIDSRGRVAAPAGPLIAEGAAAEPSASIADSALQKFLARPPAPVLICFPGPQHRSEQMQQLTQQFASAGHPVIHVLTEVGPRDASHPDGKVRLVAREPNVFELRIGVRFGLDGLDQEALESILSAFARFRQEARLVEAISLAGSSLWAPLVLALRARYGWKIVYHRMEDETGCSESRPERAAREEEEEEELLRAGDLVVSSTRSLHERSLRFAERALLLSNDIGSEHGAAEAGSREASQRARYELLSSKILDLYGKVSIIVLSYNNPEYLRLCLESIWAKTEYPNYEVIVVDNGSSSEVIDYLQAIEAREPRLRVIYNGRNLGFARGNNIGIRAARGWEYLVLLNDDTVVTGGWLSRLVRHLDDPAVGLLGPVTNGIGNEAQIEVDYQDLSGLDRFAAGWTFAHENRGFKIPMLAMYCVALRRHVFERVGLLDERYDIGMFEDDDYSLRIRQAGYEVVCAEDVFINHWNGTSFRRLKTRDYMRIFEENRRKYEEKWNRPWEPHRGRTGGEEEVRLGLWRASGGTPSTLALVIAPERIREIREQAEQSRGTIIFLPSIGWNITLFQRPHHLARAFAELGYLTIFDCSNTNIDLQGFRELSLNLYLFRGDNRALRELPDPILWSFSYNFGLKDDYSASARVIYDWIDDLEVFPYDRAFLDRTHRRALDEASVVTTVARKLHAAATLVRPDAVYLPNGVDDEHFGVTDLLPVDDPQIGELLSRRKPIAGYYGALARWFDYEMLSRVTRLRSDWNFLLIGPEYDESLRERGSELLARANVFWIGSRPYETLPAYLNLFDVAMIPFAINEITLATSPLKLYEYFAGEKPVITTPLPECEAYSEVLIARDAHEFAAALDDARSRGSDPGYRSRARHLGVKNSWRARARAVAEILSSKA